MSTASFTPSRMVTYTFSMSRTPGSGGGALTSSAGYMGLTAGLLSEDMGRSSGMAEKWIQGCEIVDVRGAYIRNAEVRVGDVRVAEVRFDRVRVACILVDGVPVVGVSAAGVPLPEVTISQSKAGVAPMASKYALFDAFTQRPPSMPAGHGKDDRRSADERTDCRRHPLVLCGFRKF